MTLLTKQLFFVSVASAALPTFAATATITHLSFMTEPQTVAPGVLSESITVQTQNSAGEAEKIEETADITFVSSSPTGKFLNSAGSSVSTSMSKGSANRNFYYRDTTLGTHVLTVTVHPRGSALLWRATQDITVGSRIAKTRSNNPINSPVVPASVQRAAIATPAHSLVLPVHRSWWQVFIDSIFPR